MLNFMCTKFEQILRRKGAKLHFHWVNWHGMAPQAKCQIINPSHYRDKYYSENRKTTGLISVQLFYIPLRPKVYIHLFKKTYYFHLHKDIGHHMVRYGIYFEFQEYVFIKKISRKYNWSYFSLDCYNFNGSKVYIHVHVHY